MDTSMRKRAFDLLAKTIAEREGVDVASITEETRLSEEVVDDSLIKILQYFDLLPGAGFEWHTGDTFGKFLDALLLD